MSSELQYQDDGKRIRYSPDSDVLYFLFAEGEEDHFEEPIPGVHVEYDAGGRVIGIEVLNASVLLQGVPLKRSA